MVVEIVHVQQLEQRKIIVTEHVLVNNIKMNKEGLARLIKSSLEEPLKDTIFYNEDFSDLTNCDENSLPYNPDTLFVELPIMETVDGVGRLRFVVTVEDVSEKNNGS